MRPSPSADPVLEAPRILEVYPQLESPRLERLGDGLMNQTFAVHDPSGEYVLQRVHPLFSPGIHANIHAVTRHLIRKGLPSPELIPTGRGELYVRPSGGPCWRLFTRLPGFTLDRCPGEAPARAAAALIARFHAALADLPHAFLPLGLTLHDTPAHLEELRSALRRSPDHPLRAAVLDLARAIDQAVERWTDFGELPRRATHGDPKFNNVLFRDSAEMAHALIDLDTVGPLPLYAELGDAWRSWCNRNPEDHGAADLDMDVWRAAARGYLDSTSLELGRRELESLAEAIERISLELAARFATDVLQETYFSWDATRFSRAGEHHLMRARTQLDLHRQARETRQERRRFLLG